MEIKPIKRAEHRIAELKLRIIRQQDIAADLIRTGQKDRARQARAKLLSMLNELDLMQDTRV